MSQASSRRSSAPAMPRSIEPRPRVKDLVGREHAAIALEAGERRLVPGLGLGGAGVVHAAHVVAAIGAVLHRVVDALVGEEAGHEHILDADIAQEIIEVGRVEDGGRGLGQHDLVAFRRDLREHLRLPRALGEPKPESL